MIQFSARLAQVVPSPALQAHPLFNPPEGATPADLAPAPVPLPDPQTLLPEKQGGEGRCSYYCSLWKAPTQEITSLESLFQYALHLEWLAYYRDHPMESFDPDEEESDVEYESPPEHVNFFLVRRSAGWGGLYLSGEKLPALLQSDSLRGQTVAFSGSLAIDADADDIDRAGARVLIDRSFAHADPAHPSSGFSAPDVDLVVGHFLDRFFGGAVDVYVK